MFCRKKRKLTLPPVSFLCSAELEKLAIEHKWEHGKLDGKLKRVRKNKKLQRDPARDNISIYKSAREMTFIKTPPRPRRANADAPPESEPAAEEEGREMTVEQYFLEAYGIKLRYPHVRAVAQGVFFSVAQSQSMPDQYYNVVAILSSVVRCPWYLSVRKNGTPLSSRTRL
jgi:hypothetical protein